MIQDGVRGRPISATAWSLIVAGEAVHHRVLVQPVEDQIVAAPVAGLTGGDPVEPLEIGVRIAGQAVVAQHDGVAAEGYR